MVATAPPASSPPGRPPLERWLVQWLAADLILDARARLVEGGAGGDTRIDLADVFVDLAVKGAKGGNQSVVRLFCGERSGWGGPDPAPHPAPVRALLIGGPGSGKTTATTMIAQLLRGQQLQVRLDEVAHLRERVHQLVRALDELRRRIGLHERSALLPVRVSLPELSRWMATRGHEDLGQHLWRFLADQARERTAQLGVKLDITAAELEAQLRARDAVLWIFDGLDEVPRSAGREQITSVIRAAIWPDPRHSVIVTTRPQGYGGEFGDLYHFLLTELSAFHAREYGELLLRAWSAGEDPLLTERLTRLGSEFAKPEIAALVQTPLHATMATLLIAQEGSLPTARHLLFEHYFDTIFKRELGKHANHGVRPEDKLLLRTLHARAGLVLQTRSQDQEGARPTLTPRELTALLAGLLAEEGQSASGAQASTARILRFAAERLVLLLRVTESGYEFGVRSLQEYFASVALLEGEPAIVKARLAEVTLNPHWANALGLVMSALAVPGASKRAKTAALDYTVALCRELNAGTLGGPSARLCMVGSRLAIAILRETERFGGPWLHDPLWAIALEAARSPIQESSARAAEWHTSHMQTLGGQWNDAFEVHARLGWMAVHWSGDKQEQWLHQLLDLAEAALDEPQHRWSGWALLMVPLAEEIPRARQIADAHAPLTPEDARRIVVLAMEGYAGFGQSSWLTQFLTAHLAWFTPGWLAGHPSWATHSRFGAQEQSWGSLFQTVGGDAPVRIAEETRYFQATREEFKGALFYLNDFKFLFRENASSTAPQDLAVWRSWYHLEQFHKDPSSAHLADALEACAEPGAWEDSRNLSHLLAWPVVVCLEFASTPDELKALAAAARAGQLGDINDWHIAEYRWSMQPAASEAELAAWLAARELPWDRDIGASGGPPGPLPQEARFIYAPLANAPRLPRRAIAWLRRTLDAVVRHYPDELERIRVPVEIAAASPVPPDQPPYDVLFAIDRLMPDLSGAAAARWFQLLDERGQQGWNRCFDIWDTSPLGRATRAHGILTEILHSLVARLTGHPEQWGLVDAIWAVVDAVEDASLEDLRLPALPPDAAARAQASAAALALLTRDLSDAELRGSLAALVSPWGEFDLRSRLVRLLGKQPDQRAVRVVYHMLEVGPAPDDEVRDRILGIIFQHLKLSALPAFTTREAWSQYQLPEPHLSGQGRDVLPPRILRLTEISNIRLFAETPEVDAPFQIPDVDHGQWIILVGENGVGKTTLLRAIGLALAEPTVATRLLDERQPLLRDGGAGRIALELDTGRLEIIIRREARTEVIAAGPRGDVARPWVAGYGVRRGTARGEKDRAPEWGPTGELHSLFDRPATLVNAVDWLLDLDRRRLNEQRIYGAAPEEGAWRPHAAAWQAVERAFDTLLEISVIEPEDLHVMVTHRRLGRVRLEALSDGYLTTAGWVIDLIARWIKRQDDLGEPIGRDLLRQITGFVLIDEIDLHLHPIWQMHIIEDVRRLFPRLSFVVTTHNPLTLHGARPGEIYIMRRADGDQIELTQQDIQPGHDVDRVLFEQFGILYTFDKETRELLDRHRKLLQAGASSDQAERVDLERQLAARLGRVGEVLVDERDDEDDLSFSEEDKRRLDERTAKGR